MHDDLANQLSVSQRFPFELEVDLFRREKRNGDVGGCFEQADVVDGISAAPQVDVDVADGAVVERAFVDGAVDVPADGVRHGEARGDEEEGDDEDDNAENGPARAAPGRGLLSGRRLLRRFRGTGG